MSSPGNMALDHADSTAPPGNMSQITQHREQIYLLVSASKRLDHQVGINDLFDVFDDLCDKHFPLTGFLNQPLHTGIRCVLHAIICKPT